MLNLALVEVILEATLRDIHDIVGDLHELVLGDVEVVVDLHNGGREGLALCVTDENVLELLELDDS